MTDVQTSEFSQNSEVCWKPQGSMIPLRMA